MKNDSYILARLHDLVQIVDGKWDVTPAGELHTAEVGYDRIVAIGDETWTDYEVEVPFTIDGIGPNAGAPLSGDPLVGFGLRWNGHGETGTQPNWGFWPTGAFSWYTLERGGRLELLANNGSPADFFNGITLTQGTTDSNELWLEVVLSNEGRVIARSGGVGPDGAVDPWSHFVNGYLLDREGNRIERRNIDDDMGGTMRLGAYPCEIAEGSKAREIYGEEHITERHRHRYEVNIGYKDRLEGAGLRFSGMSPDGELPEIVELTDHPWYVGVQFHPELKSKPTDPHPLFKSFIGAALEQSRLV